MDKITIVIPVYNVKKYLQKCIDSVLNQTYENLEVLIINDGSTDGSDKICDKNELRDNRIKVFHKKNGGVSSARNFGIEKSTGKYIMFVDSDDYIEKNMVEVLYKNIIECNFDMAICNFYNVIDDKKHVKKNSINSKKLAFNNDINEIYSSLKTPKYNYLASSVNKLIKKSSLSKIRFEENIYIGEDLLFITKVLKQSKQIVFVNEPLYNYVSRNNSVTHNASIKTLSIIPAINQIIELIGDDVSSGVIDELKKDEFYWCNKFYKCNTLSNKEEFKWVKEKRKELFKNIITSSNISFYRKIKQLIKYLF